MKKHLGALPLGALLAPSGLLHAADDFADQVVSYVQGTGSNANFKTPGVALGAPVSGNDGSTPYSIVYPAYKNTQIVGIGNGGELTLMFNTPITNDPVNHAFGMDFTIFGNEFLVNGSSGFSGAFTRPGLSVWVSEDNVDYYKLNVPHGYGADDWFPEQGTGNPLLPMDPSLPLSSVNGLNQAQVLSLYNGSAGGASFSLSWAQDADGNPVSLPSISYIEVQGTSGFGYVDAVSRVQNVPEPAGTGLLLAGTATLGFRRRPRKSTKSTTTKSTNNLN
jgi:hypothetical protein